MRAAELFVKCLENEGVKYIFGVPGEENAHFMLALEDSPIDFIICRHEQGAAFIADVYGRISGRASVCLGTLGPGATNLVTGVADANMDRAPLIVITGQAESVRQHKESHQNMDVVAMFRPLTKWAQPILHSSNIPEVVRKAFKLALQEKPGACHIELANDIAGYIVAEGLAPINVTEPKLPGPDAEVIDQAMDMLAKAKRPIILAGNGVIRVNATDELRKLAEQTGIGVVSTFMGKGVVPRSAPHCLFTVGLQARDYSWFAINESDLIITLGYDLVEYLPAIWNDPCGKKPTIIHADFLPAEADAYYQADLEIVGDLSKTLSLMNQHIQKHGLPEYDLAYQAEHRQKMLADFAEYKDDEAKGLIKPQKILWDIRETLGPDDILLSDVGAHKMWVARYYHCDEPNTCLISNGFCSMGFALPGAIGAKVVFPDKKVVAVCGDGAFIMNIQELETACRIGANLVAVIWEDNEYGLIKWKQKNQFGKSTDLRFNNPDFVKLAEAFDCKGIRVENSADFRPALEEAFTYDCPVLISVPIDYRENEKLTERLGQLTCAI